MSEWEQMHAERIWEVHKTLPDDATLEDRIKALRKITPSSSDPSWSRKTWQRARLKYLTKFGYVSKHKKKLPESPLERMMRRSELTGVAKW